MIDSVKNKIKAYISESKEAGQAVKFAYIFGSVLHSEKFRKNSDIDLAFFIDRSLYKKDPLSASAPAFIAATEVGLLLNHQTDVIILNSASIETAYQVITTGKVLYETNHEERIEYEISLKGLYYDFKPFLEELRKKSISRLCGKERNHEVN